ncbi:hypothetical protein ASF27_13895 [Methylobacterium sp. Leaf102]|jgi:hypothetical protein|uniref:hypothetical protein n=1 Tax=unclassified Methylobacterium TaxID=2615210 RepID=UPI0006FE2DA2|nr:MULTISPECIES: hypothetical protein [unclassified Methylobacterium]USU32515.1 hypothetical protein NG677_02010 [Methylobacterium sp. OTU13CASTA1]KQO55253.1 hypothetical protein ASF22_11660 [Methylobacterium sp. Leaf87]KQP17438.1 hypothetical protein ASF25_13240 [Methylobacterium sp. Leaf100]KQP22202.1 hypothetical protein ASF27_13895 [Methylobacterium sp. Leaf102]KQP59410.1 hypothetical protein ASF52_10760 [Methylobacterium sp. Leaf112]
MTFDDARDDFSRLHRLFTFHLGVGVGLSWMTTLYAACYAPWVRNIRALIDPAAGLDRVESTLSFLFVLPAVLTIAWVSLFFGRELLRRSQTLSSAALEFAAAAVVAFGVFTLSIDRAVAALYAGL